MSGRALLFVIALALALGSPWPAPADARFEAAGQLYFTFAFGADGDGPERPRVGLRLGAQPAVDPADRRADLFTTSLGLELDLAGQTALSLGGIALPFGAHLSDAGSEAREGLPVVVRRLGAGAQADPRAASEQPTGTVPLSVEELPVAVGHWVFWPLDTTIEARAAVMAREIIPAAGPADRRSAEAANAAQGDAPATRGRWRFLPIDNSDRKAVRRQAGTQPAD